MENQVDNSDTMTERKSAKGEKTGKRYSAGQWRQAREMYASGAKVKAISQTTGIGEHTIYHRIRREKWKTAEEQEVMALEEEGIGKLLEARNKTGTMTEAALIKLEEERQAIWAGFNSDVATFARDVMQMVDRLHREIKTREDAAQVAHILKTLGLTTHLEKQKGPDVAVQVNNSGRDQDQPRRGIAIPV